MLGLLSESEDYQILLFISCTNLNFRSLIDFLFKCCQILSHSIFTAISIYIFSIAVTPVECILSVVVLQIWTFSG